MSNPSTIQITYQAPSGSPIDITRYVVYSQTRFTLVGSATPGTATITISDRHNELDPFTVGGRIVLTIDGIRMWGGLVMTPGMGLFFPVVDTTDLDHVTARMIVLECADFNTYMDKRVIRDTSNYLSKIYIGPLYLGDAISYGMTHYMDEVPDLDFITKVERTNIKHQDKDGKAAPLSQQSTIWRRQLDIWQNLGAFEWWIDASLFLHFHTLQNLVAPWAFVDRNPDGVKTIGFREGFYREDGNQMATDALVWGGSSLLTDTLTVFGRYPVPPAADEQIYANGELVATLTAATEQEALDRIDTYGRWQKAEVHINEEGFYTHDGVQYRAFTIVAGDTGSLQTTNVESGLGRPVMSVNLAWFSHRVPGHQHIVPGQISTFVFWALGKNGKPLARTLPLRNLDISFPTLPSDNPNADPLTYVRFDGQFGINYSDSRFLWRFLRQRNLEIASSAFGGTTTSVPTVTNESNQTVLGAIGGLVPNEPTDGVRTVFTLPFTYIPGSLQVYMNGLLQRPILEYTESDPGSGEFTFVTAPYADDAIWVQVRTGSA